MPDKPIRICFVLDQVLQHYRVPLFSKLNKKGYDITICYPEWFKRKSPTLSELDQELAASVKAIPLKNRKWLGLYYFGVKNLVKFDLVIFMQDLRVIDFWITTLNPFRKQKLIHWGIGVSDFNNKNRLDIGIRNLVTTFASSLILYSDEAKKLYSESNQNKIVVANNTIENKESEDFSGEEKDSFLFIGSLDRRKGLKELVRTFSIYLEKAKSTDIRKLVIIGEGEMQQEIENLTTNLGIRKNLYFTGAVNKDYLKKEFFKNAQLCISLKQAGLSVLESFSYGVPFVTLKNSETGGERFNIRHEETGFLLESEDELPELFHFSQKNRSKIEEMGTKAFRFYQEQRSMENMVQSFLKAIEYAMK